METITTYQQLSVLIESIFTQYFTDKNTRAFTGNHERIHRNFYSLKKHYPEYFHRLSFDENNHYPYSRDLDAILQDFQICGIINKLNPTFKTIIFNGDTELQTRMTKKIPFVKDEELVDIASELTI